MSTEVPWRGGFCGISRQDKKAPHNSDFVHVARQLPRVSGLDKFGKLNKQARVTGLPKSSLQITILVKPDMESKSVSCSSQLLC